MLQHSNVGIGRYPQNQNPRIFEHKSQHSVYNWASERQWLLSLHRYMTRPLVTVTQNIDDATCCSCWHMITVSSWMNGRGGRLSWRGGGPGGWPRTGGRRRRRRRRRWRRSAILNQRQQLNTETGLNNRRLGGCFVRVRDTQDGMGQDSWFCWLLDPFSCKCSCHKIFLLVESSQKGNPHFNPVLSPAESQSLSSPLVLVKKVKSLLASLQPNLFLACTSQSEVSIVRCWPITAHLHQALVLGLREQPRDQVGPGQQHRYHHHHHH